MTLTRRLIAFFLLIPAAAIAQSGMSAPVSISALPLGLRVTVPVAPAYHATTKSTRITVKSKRAKLSTVKGKPVRHSRLRRIVWNPLLPGSHESQLKQNEEIDDAGLPRIQNDEELDQLIERQELLPLSDSRYVLVSPNVKPDRRYSRAVVQDFLDDLGRAYYEEFHQPIQVTSAVRTAEQQRKLRRHNSNAAPESGDTGSSHLSGLTVDLAKRGMTRKQHAWLENYLAGLKADNVIEPLEERRQACFHVMVFQRYDDWRDGKLARVEIAPPAAAVTSAPLPAIPDPVLPNPPAQQPPK